MESPAKQSSVNLIFPSLLAYADILSRTIQTVMCQLPADTSAQSVSGSAYNTASLADTAVSAADTAAYPAFSGRQYGQTG